jgi:hypothetical protein
VTAYHRTSRWLTFTKKVRPVIQQTLPRPCVDPKPGCPGAVQPGDLWDVAHLPGLEAHRNPWMPLSIDVVGPAHRSCNRSQGARMGRAKQLARTRTNTKLPGPESGW